MDFETPESIGMKMDALGLWEAAGPYNWAVKPRGTAFPYFCTLFKGDGKSVKTRLLMLEGWQTFHDWMRTRVDRNWGFYSTPMELPHFELVVSISPPGAFVVRDDPGYLPRELTGRERELVTKILWESYGLMMRLESETKLPLKYAGERAMFARVETESGWEDRPLPIPEPRPHVERVSIAKSLIANVKDLPLRTDFALEFDFRLIPGLSTREARPRAAYGLFGAEEGRLLFREIVSAEPDGGLKAMWESLAPRLLKRIESLGKMPGEIKVVSGRVFRLLRTLVMDIPFKLSLHDSLPALEKAIASGENQK